MRVSALAPPAAAFELCAGHPVLDFVNTLDFRFRAAGPSELLPDYAALLRFGVQSRLLDERQARRLRHGVEPRAAASVWRSACELREALARALYDSIDARAPSAEDLRLLARAIGAAYQQRELTWTAPARAADTAPVLVWSYGGNPISAELPLWMLAERAAELLTSQAMEHVRACGADVCRWLFLDTSKNHTRRWCNMKVCGNRAKARRHQQRQR